MSSYAAMSRDHAEMIARNILSGFKPGTPECDEFNRALQKYVESGFKDMEYFVRKTQPVVQKQLEMLDTAVADTAGASARLNALQEAVDALYGNGNDMRNPVVLSAVRKAWAALGRGEPK